MSGIVFGGFVPTATVRNAGSRQALGELAQELRSARPDMLAVVSRGTNARTTLGISSAPEHQWGGDFLSRLRAEASQDGIDLSDEPPLDEPESAEKALLRCIESKEAEHRAGVATTVQANLSLEAHYHLGQAIQQAAAAMDRRVGVLACATPSPFSHWGLLIARRLGKTEGSEASASASRPLAVLCGALARLPVLPRILHGQGSPDKSYALASFSVASGPRGPHPFVRLARETLERALLTDSLPDLQAEPLDMQGRAGAFVCLKKMGELRGCVGTIRPARETLAEEIMQNALSAALRDYRFPPVDPEELPYLTYTVDVLAEPESVESLAGHDPQVHGLVAEAGSRRGILLPDIPGISTPEQQLEVCRMKAGIGPGEPVKLYRFTVQRYKEVETD